MRKKNIRPWRGWGPVSNPIDLFVYHDFSMLKKETSQNSKLFQDESKKNS